MEKFKKVRFGLYIRECLRNEIEAYCAEKGMPMSLFIDIAIEKELKRIKEQK